LPVSVLKAANYSLSTTPTPNRKSWLNPHVIWICSVNRQIILLGIEFEGLGKKIMHGVEKVKRNKKTIILAHEELTPLTEHILAKMGKEGSLIRLRLKSFYRDRALLKEPPYDQPLEPQAFEAGN
jgi:hypothetical protein